jgi:hypothetical protein
LSIVPRGALKEIHGASDLAVNEYVLRPRSKTSMYRRCRLNASNCGRAGMPDAPGHAERRALNGNRLAPQRQEFSISSTLGITLAGGSLQPVYPMCVWSIMWSHLPPRQSVVVLDWSDRRRPETERERLRSQIVRAGAALRRVEAVLSRGDVYISFTMGRSLRRVKHQLEERIALVRRQFGVDRSARSTRLFHSEYTRSASLIVNQAVGVRLQLFRLPPCRCNWCTG